VIDGPAEAGFGTVLEQRATDLGVGDRVALTESSRNELPVRYAAADVVLFTSLWDEPQGLVPLEAMACGTPVIATGTGGSVEYLRHEENCLLVSPGEPAALAAAVRRLAGDIGLRARLRAGGILTAGRFSADTQSAILEAVHLEAAGRRKAAA
jgi:glycosyltransferase involved in cell wall biosynthesis